MIQANELRFGNWVHHDNTFCNPFMKMDFELLKNEISPNGEFPELSPIPLTPELLEKCGLERLPNTNHVFRIIINDIEISISVRLSYLYIDTKWGQASIKNPIFEYLHQLQNAVYALTGEELEFKLCLE